MQALVRRSNQLKYQGAIQGRKDIKESFTVNLLKERIHIGAVRPINRANSIVFHGNRPDIGLGNEGQNVETIKRLSHSRHHRTNKLIINIR